MEQTEAGTRGQHGARAGARRPAGLAGVQEDRVVSVTPVPPTSRDRGPSGVSLEATCMKSSTGKAPPTRGPLHSPHEFLPAMKHPCSVASLLADFHLVFPCAIRWHPVLLRSEGKDFFFVLMP